MTLAYDNEFISSGLRDFYGKLVDPKLSPVSKANRKGINFNQLPGFCVWLCKGLQ